MSNIPIEKRFDISKARILSACDSSDPCYETPLYKMFPKLTEQEFKEHFKVKPKLFYFKDKGKKYTTMSLIKDDEIHIKN